MDDESYNGERFGLPLCVSGDTEDRLPLGTNNDHDDEDVLDDDYGSVFGIQLGKLDDTEDGLPLGADDGPDGGEVFVDDGEVRLEGLLGIQYQKTLVSVVLEGGVYSSVSMGLFDMVVEGYAVDIANLGYGVIQY